MNVLSALSSALLIAIVNIFIIMFFIWPSADNISRSENQYTVFFTNDDNRISRFQQIANAGGIVVRQGVSENVYIVFSSQKSFLKKMRITRDNLTFSAIIPGGCYIEDKTPLRSSEII